MESISSEDDLNEMLSREHSVVYFYLDWSAYSIKGLRLLEELECSLSGKGSPVIFRLADVSDDNAPAAFMFEWLKRRERSDLKLCNRIAVGSGSVMWLTRGEIADFESHALQHDVPALGVRTNSTFRLGET